MAFPKADARPAPRLMLVTPELVDTDGLAPALAAACSAADIAAVIIRLTDADERTLINRLKALASVQDHGAALLVEGRAGIVARAGADGAHLVGTDALVAALPTLKPDRIAGAGGLHSRDDAMVAAERGADYVLFGEPDETGHRPSLDAIVERVAWWAEIFALPCVAYAARLDEVEQLARAGADFVACSESIWSDPRTLAAAAAHLVASERVP